MLNLWLPSQTSVLNTQHAIQRERITITPDQFSLWQNIGQRTDQATNGFPKSKHPHDVCCNPRSCPRQLYQLWLCQKALMFLMPVSMTRGQCSPAQKHAETTTPNRLNTKQQIITTQYRRSREGKLKGKKGDGGLRKKRWGLVPSVTNTTQMQLLCWKLLIHCKRLCWSTWYCI